VAECKVDYSPPSSAEAKSEWRYTSNTPICHQAVERDFTFYFTWPPIPSS